MLRTVRNVQTIGEVHITNVRHHNLGNVEGRGILVMMILTICRAPSHTWRTSTQRCGMTLRAVESNPLKEHGVLVPNILVVVRARVSVVVHWHTVDEYCNVA